jgi:hypothetical protein
MAASHSCEVVCYLFGKKGGKIGSRIFVRKPPRAIGRDGQAMFEDGDEAKVIPVRDEAAMGWDSDG